MLLRALAWRLLEGSTAAMALPPQGAEVERPAPEVDDVVVLERVDIEGLQNVSREQVETILRRHGLEAGATLREGQEASVNAARQELGATGFFRSVTLSLRPIPPGPEGGRRRAAMAVRLRERTTLTLTDLPWGGSRYTRFFGGVGLLERNFLGRQVELGAELSWGTRSRVVRGRNQQAYRVYAEVPHFKGTRIGLLASAHVVSANEPFRVSGPLDDPDVEHFEAFDYSRAGGILGVTYRAAEALELGADLQFERIDARLPARPIYTDASGDREAIDLGFQPGGHNHTVARFSAAWDGRDEITGAGGRFLADLKLSSPLIGSDYEYIEFVAGGAWALRLPWKHHLVPSASGGQIVGAAPRFVQFYGGDLAEWVPGRIQGLRYSTRNPIDVLGSGINRRSYGSLFARLDLEYAWPLFRRVRTHFFHGGDLFLSFGAYTIAGDAEQREAQRELGQRVAPIGLNGNLGIRFDSALGTWNISVANTLRRFPL